MQFRGSFTSTLSKTRSRIRIIYLQSFISICRLRDMCRRGQGGAMPGQTLYGSYERVQVNYSLGLPGYRRAMECRTSCGGKSQKGDRCPPRFAMKQPANSCLDGERLPPAAVSQDPAEHEPPHPAAGAAGLDAAREDADGERAEGRERQGGNGGDDSHPRENGPDVGAEKHPEEQAGEKRRREPTERHCPRRFDRGQSRLRVWILDVEIGYAHFPALQKSFSLRDNSNRPPGLTVTVSCRNIRSAPPVGLTSFAPCRILRETSKTPFP